MLNRLCYWSLRISDSVRIVAASSPLPFPFRSRSVLGTVSSSIFKFKKLNSYLADLAEDGPECRNLELEEGEQSALDIPDRSIACEFESFIFVMLYKFNQNGE
jgi:hypothetical protein